MSDLHRIAKNTTILFITDMVNKVLGFLYVAYSVRYLGDAGFGTISAAIALVAILSFFSDIGLSTLIVREVARNKSAVSKYMNNVIGAKIPMNIFTFIIIFIAAFIRGYPPETVLLVCLIGLSTIVGSFYSVFNAVFQAHEKMEYQSIGQVLNALILLAGAIIAITFNMDIIVFAAFYLIASVATALFEFAICAWKFVMPGISFDMAFISSALKESLPFGLTGSFITVYYMVSSVLLSYMVNDTEVGWYNMAYKLVLFLGFVPGILFGAVFPVSARLFTSSKDMLRFLFERSLKYLLIFAIPLGVGTVLLADRFIVTIYGVNSKPTSIALQILIWSEVFIFVSMALANLLNSINRQTVVTKQTALSAVVNVVFNLVTIPLFGYVGACMVTVLTEAVAMGFLFMAVMKSEFRIPGFILRDVAKIVAASLLMGAFIFFFNGRDTFQGTPGLLAIVIISIGIYFISIILLKTLDTVDTDLVKRLVAGWRGELR